MPIILNNSNEAGGFPYILGYLDLYMPYTALTCLGVCVGVLGNMLIVGSILTSKELRSNPTFVLIFNLAITDFSISFLIDSFSIVGMFLSIYCKYRYLAHNSSGVYSIFKIEYFFIFM